MLGVPRGATAIAVACSGGPDSGATLHIVRRVRPQALVYACYVDHGVRPAVARVRDLAAVRAQARAADATVARLRTKREPASGASPEASMRSGRYAALASFARSVGASCVVTGHQRDDLAESMVLALARGSGIDGLAAMKPRRQIAKGVYVVRPLIWISRSTLARYADANGLSVSVDETNADERYRRNAVRALLRGLEDASPGSTRAIARACALIAEDKSLLDGLTLSAWKRSATRMGTALSASVLRTLPFSLLRRVVRFAVRRAAGTARDFSYDHCAAIARAVKEGRGGVYHAGAMRAVLSGGRLVLQERVPSVRKMPRLQRTRITVPRRSMTLSWGGGKIEIRSNARSGSAKSSGTGQTLRLDGGVLKPGTRLYLRYPSAGDKIVPSGRRTPVSLSRFLAKEGLSREERAAVPLLCHGNTIAAVLGVRAAASSAAAARENVLEVRWSAPKLSSSRRTADD